MFIIYKCNIFKYKLFNNLFISYIIFMCFPFFSHEIYIYIHFILVPKAIFLNWLFFIYFVLNFISVLFQWIQMLDSFSE